MLSANWQPFYLSLNVLRMYWITNVYTQFYMITLTHKRLETHGCIIITVATDALVLKHQAISIHSVDKTFIVLEWFHKKIFYS